MSKFLNSKTLYMFVFMALIIVIFWLTLRTCSSSESVQASVSPLESIIGKEVVYSDSTSGAKSWYWEFGDGAASDQRSGKHIFRQEGIYRVRLTVNRNTERFFDVKVSERINSSSDRLIHIIAPTEGLQGQNIVFKGEGKDEQWRWEFGESGMVDSREKIAIYSYSEPGIYKVLLSTENTRYPIRHEIKILPYYTENDSTDMLTLIGLDIKEKLQNIVDGRSFNTNYNHILKEYLGGNHNTPVVINNNKYNDFYSYCQGLRHLGRGVTVIENVVADVEDEQINFISKISVLQFDKQK